MILDYILVIYFFTDYDFLAENFCLIDLKIQYAIFYQFVMNVMAFTLCGVE